MTDAEVICTWMQPERNLPWWEGFEIAPKWRPRKLTLDRLWEVEEQLSEEQWWRYKRKIWRISDELRIADIDRFKIHIKAEQKIKALAEVIRAKK